MNGTNDTRLITFLLLFRDFQETQGVTVATYGPTTDFPAFYSQKSGFQSPWNVDSIDQAARLIRSSFLSLLTLSLPLFPSPSFRFYVLTLASSLDCFCADTGLTLPSPLSSLLAVPIPDEFQPAGAYIQEAVELAVKESLNAGIVGKEMT